MQQPNKGPQEPDDDDTERGSRPPDDETPTGPEVLPIEPYDEAEKDAEPPELAVTGDEGAAGPGLTETVEERAIPLEATGAADEAAAPAGLTETVEERAVPLEATGAADEAAASPEIIETIEAGVVPLESAAPAEEGTPSSQFTGTVEMDVLALEAEETLEEGAVEPGATVADVWAKTISGSDNPEMTIKSGPATIAETDLGPAPPPAELLDVLGDKADDYEIIEKIGEGGMGVVYRARQKSLDRDVALKTFKRPSDRSKEATIRGPFIAEAVVTGHLDHPNIMPVHTLEGDPDGRSFYTMKRIVGRSWKETMDLMAFEQNLGVLLDVCDAISCAHSKGVIHRDLKPDNVMLGDYGEVIVMDWGLAASVEREGKAEDIKKTSQVGGTPAYLAPEMARDNRDKIGRCSDIYLLGGVLFRIITGLTPHTGKSVLHCMMNAAENVIQETNKSGELLDIALKAMATEPEDRHATVAELQQDIRAYMAHAESIALADNARALLKEAKETGHYDTYARAVFGFEEALSLWKENASAKEGLGEGRLAYARAAYEGGDFDLGLSVLEKDDREEAAELKRQISAAKEERLRKERAVRRLKIGVTSLAVALIVALTIGFLWIRSERNKTEIARQAEQKQRKIAEENWDTAERRGYAANVGLTQMKIADQRFDEAQRLLDSCPKHLREWAWGFLKHLCHLDLLTYRGHDSEVGPIAISPDGKVMASGDWGGKIKLWEADSGRDLLTLEGHTNKLGDLAFSPDGARLASASDDKTVRLWDTASGKLLGTLEGHEDEVWCVAFSHDGEWLASGSRDGTVKIWDPRVPEELASIGGFDGAVASMAFSPAGALAVGSGDLTHSGTVTVLTKATWQEAFTSEAYPDRVNSVAFSPDGRVIAAGAWDGLIRFLSTAGKELGTLKATTRGAIFTLAFSPDGKHLASAGEDHTIRVWDWQNGRLVSALVGHSDTVGDVAFFPDSLRLASGSTDGSVKVWDVRTSTQALELRGHRQTVAAVAFSPDSKLVASAGQDGTVRLWDPQSGENTATMDAAAGAANALAFSPDGATLAAAYGEKILALWDMDSLQIRTKLEGHEEVVRSVAFSPDGRLVASGGWDDAVKVWDATTGENLRTIHPGEARIQAVAFSPDGRRIAVASRDRHVYVCDVETGEVTVELVGHSEW
ncbi:MAG: serine/threonine protein kinase, partial [Candidatus Brocadiae bacterium]|nr:serine/threonine protein kinase [Candidatus Brocadiia bacterium]